MYCTINCVIKIQYKYSYMADQLIVYDDSTIITWMRFFWDSNSFRCRMRSRSSLSRFRLLHAAGATMRTAINRGRTHSRRNCMTHITKSSSCMPNSCAHALRASSCAPESSSGSTSTSARVEHPAVGQSKQPVSEGEDEGEGKSKGER